MERRLAAILAADVVGYTRETECAEEKTVARLLACQSRIDDIARSFSGRVFHRAGDSVMVEFGSPVAALRCAVHIQYGSDSESALKNDAERLRLRIGLHFADVIVSGTDLLGDGINIAARIQQEADPDDVLVSEDVFRHVRRHSPFTFEDLGPRNLKNIAEPIRIFRVIGVMPFHRLQSAPSGLVRPAQVREASIAVLPFSVMGNDDEQQYYADGLTEEVIVELTRFRRLFVTSRSATFAYEGQAADLREVGRDLGVRYVLQGQLRRSTNEVRITVHLIEAATQEIVWAERFSRTLSELFDMLDEIASRIAATIFGRLEVADMAAAHRRHPQDMSAYDFLLRGLQLHRLGGVTQDNVREALQWIERAIEADPDYAPAYAWHVCAASWLPDFDLEREWKCGQRALELDENDPEAHRIMGFLELHVRNFEVAEYHHCRAMELNPSDAYIKGRTAAFYTFKGDPRRALALIDEAIELDPFLPE